jgi:DNA-binding CsgD family transcriptional regulator
MGRAQSSTTGLAEPAQQFRIMLVPFMIEMSHDPATRQARSGRVSLTPTEASVAERVGEGRYHSEMAVKLLLSQRTVATRLACLRKLGARSRIDTTREPALRAAASR